MKQQMSEQHTAAMVDTSELQAAAKALGLATSGGKSDLEASTVRLTFRESSLTMTASDNLMSASVRLEAHGFEAEEPVTCYTSVYRLATTVGALSPAKSAVLEYRHGVNGPELRIEGVGTRFSAAVPLAPAREFVSDGFGERHVIADDMTYAEFSAALKAALWLVPTRTSDPAFAGVHVIGQDVVATNIVSMVCYSLPNEVFQLPAKDLGLDRRFAAALCALPVPADVRTQVAVDNAEDPRRVYVFTPGMMFSMPAIAKKFPDYGPYITIPEGVTRVDLSATEMCQSLGRINALLREDKAPFMRVALTFDDHGIIQMHANPQAPVADAVPYVGECQPDGSPPITLDSETLEVGLRQFTDDEVTMYIEYTKPSPIHIIGRKGKGELHLSILRVR